MTISPAMLSSVLIAEIVVLAENRLPLIPAPLIPAPLIPAPLIPAPLIRVLCPVASDSVVLYSTVFTSRCVETILFGKPTVSEPGGS